MALKKFGGSAMAILKGSSPSMSSLDPHPIFEQANMFLWLLFGCVLRAPMYLCVYLCNSVRVSIHQRCFDRTCLLTHVLGLSWQVLEHEEGPTYPNVHRGAGVEGCSNITNCHRHRAVRVLYHHEGVSIIMYGGPSQNDCC